MGAGLNEVELTRLHITQSLDDGLRWLGTDHVDLYQVQTINPITPIERPWRRWTTPCARGKVRYIGASNYAAWQLKGTRHRRPPRPHAVRLPAVLLLPGGPGHRAGDPARSA
jgi:aryl-alcohol dehydrogenase-like predicted oxidoreductase